MLMIHLRKSIFFIFIFFCPVTSLWAQKALSLDEIEEIKTTSPAVWNKTGDKLYFTSSKGLWSYEIKKGSLKELPLQNGFLSEPRISRNGQSLGVQCGSEVCIVNLSDASIVKKVTGEIDSRWDIKPDGTDIVFAGKGYIWSRVSIKGQQARVKKSPEMFGQNELYIDEHKVLSEEGIVWIFSPYGSPFEWSPDGKRLYFLSAKTGWTKIWSMRNDGLDIRQETFGEGDDRDFRILRNGSIIFVSNRNKRMEWSLFLKPYGKNARHLFGKDCLIRGINLSSDEKKVSFQYSTPVMPEELFIYDLYSNKALQITHNSPLEPKNLIFPTVVKFRSQSREIEGMLFMPESSKAPLPAVILLHGGPSMHDGLSWNSLRQYLVTRSYVVLDINYTGSAGYGKAFEEADRFRIGIDDCDDVAHAAFYLSTLPRVDKKRIGVTGSSYGGYLTNLVIGRYPEVFAAAVDWFGITDWRSLEVPRLHPVVRYFFRDRLGDSLKHRDLYTMASPVSYAKAIKTPIMIVHGDSDFVVPFSQSLEFLDSLKKNHKKVEFIRYSNEGHGWTRKETRLDALNKMLWWFDTYLKRKED
ncbi:MAG: S9 family peptidase [Ignavibacteria bacterium]|jgi:dipeptidyl aminopeptidase/acylaminoacyl peptidase|nr:S9 family peptidase [Ignavibacteria bacterium]MCU7502470.1 S9 family peptidase [Ignavibacteria bacterium]MCU7514965.1 S9 family peptidase [Ignavibacteria bacterium]